MVFMHPLDKMNTKIEVILSQPHPTTGQLGHSILLLKEV